MAITFVDSRALPKDVTTCDAFVYSGAGTLRQIDVHLSPRFITEWLE